MKTERRISAGGVLFRRTAGGLEVLLAARRVRSGDVVWGLPKGLVEEGEGLEAAAVREVREETGWSGSIRAPLGEIAYWFVWEGTRIHKVVHFFLIEAESGDESSRDQEMLEVRWFPAERAAEVAGFESEREVLARATAAIQTLSEP